MYHTYNIYIMICRDFIPVPNLRHCYVDYIILSSVCVFLFLFETISPLAEIFSVYLYFSFILRLKETSERNKGGKDLY